MSNKFNIGDRVKLVSERMIDTAINPIWGGKHGNTEGTVKKILENCPYSIYVKWDNIFFNMYKIEDLELVVDPFIMEIGSIFDDIIKEVNNG